uniref:Hypothetical chloroplast RF19 n=1 Tax=Lens culinaris TaxID=3864 RepID=A0A023ING1_LENCU|nr:hypothetical chloroplast RF19 [Lens culinaris]
MNNNYVIRAYLVGFCIKILNSAIVIGFYYGFLTTFSIGPSYLFLIRAQVMEEGSETKIAATTGFITGRLMMFISIYYAPFYLALCKPHTITVLTLPYVFFNFVHKNNKHYYLGNYYLGSESKLDSGYKNPNSIGNFRIVKVFFNNLCFQLLNPFLLPSSILIRLLNIYLYRSNNKLLFLTTSFVGWLIGHIFLMKCIGLVLVWLQQKIFIKSKITMRFDKYILQQLRDYAGQIFVVFAFVIVGHYLGRTAFPYFYVDEMMQYDDRNLEDLKAARAWEKKGTNEETNEEMTEEEEEIEMAEDYLRAYFLNPKEKVMQKLIPFDKALVTTIFDYQKWTRPFRYIQNDHFDRVIRDENSQFYFHTCESDGKKRISFTYPSNLSDFRNKMEKKMDLLRIDKTSSNEKELSNEKQFSNSLSSLNQEERKKLSVEKQKELQELDKTPSNEKELSNSWSSFNEEKRKKLSNEFVQRAKLLDKKYNQFHPVDVDLEDILENRIRLCDDESNTQYLIKKYDPFLNGRFRGEIQKSFSPLITNTTNDILINRIHGLLLCHNSNSSEFEHETDQFDRKLLSTEIGFFFNLISKFSEKSVSSLNFDGLYLFPEQELVNIYSEEKTRQRDFLLDAIRTEPTNDTIYNRKLSPDINEISKELPRWSYQLVDEIAVLMDANPKESQIRSPKADRIVLYSEKKKSQNDNPDEKDSAKEIALPNYSREPDYCRDIIRGSMRAQRRKIATYKLFEPNVHSPLFLESMDDYALFFGDLFDDIGQYLKEYFRKPGTDNSDFLEFEKGIEQKLIEQEKDESEDRLRQIEEAWENILYGLVIRSFVLLFQSIFRKYILLPSLIITKNIIRILLFQNPEWSEDYRDWNREIHIKCTYQGVPVSQTELPLNWFWDGIQIRILCPFVLKPWHNSKVRSTERKKKSTEKNEERNFMFLTGYGTLVKSYLDDHVPNPFLFLGPIFKKIKKQLKKELKNRFFLVLKVFINERKKGFRIMLEEIYNWNRKSLLFGFKKRDELSESEKNSTISNSNPMIEESPVIIQSINWTNSSYTEKRIKDLNVKTKTILKQIEKMTEEEQIEKMTEEKKTELKTNSWQIFKRRKVRLIRKSSSFFKIFMGRVYREMLLNMIHIIRRSEQRFLNYLQAINKIVNVVLYNKKINKQRVDKTNKSIIPFMSIIEKSGNITDMNSQNSYDVSSLSQAYVFFKLSQSLVNNGYNYKLRSIFESHGRSFFLKNEIKDYFFRIQGGRVNSKLSHKKRPDSRMNQWTNWFKKRPDSRMNQWTNWLKVHYQYALPKSAWSILVPQKWRNRIHEHHVAQNKNLVEYDSSQKKPLIFNKKQEVDFLKQKKKIKKQYGYDLFSYQYLNYADNQKSYIYGYNSPLQAKAISNNYNIPKSEKELFDIMDDSFIQNYIEGYFKDIDIDIDKNRDRKYFHLMGMNEKRKKNYRTKTNHKLLTPRFQLFSKAKVSAYKEDPWILPMQFFFLEFYGNKNITDEHKLALEKKEYESLEDLEFYLSHSDLVKVKGSVHKYRRDLQGEKNFLLDKYLGFYLHCKIPVQETLMNNINLQILLIKMKNIKKFFIMSVRKADLDIETMIRMQSKDTCYTESRDTEEVRDYLLFFMEPIRISRKNLEQCFIYQMITIYLKHKRLFAKRCRKYNLLDLLVPEHLLSTRRRKELRILSCLKPRNSNTVHKNTKEVHTKKKDFDSDTKKLIDLKRFLWPNYRFEDLACMNRYWFDTHNGSRFSIFRIHMYPRL